MAIQNQLSIISGPAGTGKTTILVKIVKELKQLGYDVQLCAPTGRAAKRMSEVTNMKSVTIHNLLKFSAETKLPLYNRDFPLTRNCFIIDEASMIDLKIASYLFEAIQSGSKVVIIGDVHQLPSIGPGKMLSDLIECKFFPVKELNQVFRQSGTSYILDFATKVRNGEHLDFGTLPSKSDFKFAEMSGLKEIQNAIKQLVQRFVAAGKYDPFEDLQIITPIHAGPIGTKELNSHIQDILNPLKTTEVSYGDRIYRPNDKVIQLSNNPDKELVNGDIGKILRVNAKEKHIVVDFYGRVVDFYDEELFELDLGYVLTVHKIQGGECPFIIMPYHSSFGQFMLNRKLFYTAITRAKRQMLIVGEEEAVKNSIDNNDSDVRYCNLIPRLKSARMDHLFN
jgi:exodeoxyribonuclease V alpha subunit